MQKVIIVFDGQTTNTLVFMKKLSNNKQTVYITGKIGASKLYQALIDEIDEIKDSSEIPTIQRKHRYCYISDIIRTNNYTHEKSIEKLNLKPDLQNSPIGAIVFNRLNV